MTIVVNPAARSGRGDDPSDELRAGLPAAEIVALDDADGLDSSLRNAAARGNAIGVVGGDGSINTAAAIALECDCPLMVVPGGTLNHFARDLGVESVDDAIRAVQAQRLVEVDVGTMDGHVFVNTASFGIYSKLVEAREQLEGKLGKWLAFIVALVRVVRANDPFDVEVDGTQRRVWTIFIGNCAYEPAGFAPSSRASLDDGQFDVRIVDGSQSWARTRLIFAALTRTLERSDVYSRELVTMLTLSTRTGENLLAADGEVFPGGAAFTVKKHPQRLKVYG